MRGWNLLWLALALPACTDGWGAGSSASDDDDDGGGGLAGDDDGNGGGQGDGGGGGTACANTFPLDAVGRELEYSYRDEEYGYTGGWTVTYEGAEDFEGEAAWVSLADYWMEKPESDYDSVYTLRSWYRCDDQGAWLLGSEYDLYAVSAGTETEYWSSTIYTQPGLTMPKEISAGDTWTYTYALVQTDSYGNETEISDSIAYDVESPVSVTVPAGTFQAWPITSEVSGTAYTWYAADDVGMVQAANSELVELRE